jgi:hypothetical protein
VLPATRDGELVRLLRAALPLFDSRDYERIDFALALLAERLEPERFARGQVWLSLPASHFVLRGGGVSDIRVCFILAQSRR